MAAASRIFLPPSLSQQLAVFKVIRSAVAGRSPPVATAPPSPATSALPSSTTPTATAVADDRPEGQMARNPVLEALKPHLPMIRFRKGGLARATATAPATTPVIPAASHGATVAAATAKADWSPKSTSVDWWQTPNKYRRRELDDIEIEAINMGGADQLYR